MNDTVVKNMYLKDELQSLKNETDINQAIKSSAHQIHEKIKEMPKIIKEVLKSGSFRINKNITNIIIKGGNTPLTKVFISFNCFLVKDSAIYRIKANLAISEG